MSTGKYILNDNHEPVIEHDLFKWASWIENTNWKVEKTKISDEITVSTVFLGLDHNLSNEGPLLLFETMVFDGKLDQEMERYSTWQEAVEGHIRWVDRVKQAESG
jgi:hypothetical protein